MSDGKKKHKAVIVTPCPEHGVHEDRITFEFDDEAPTTGETVYESEAATTVGYSRKYAEQWEATFRPKKAEA
jgi:hypothetical protein